MTKDIAEIPVLLAAAALIAVGMSHVRRESRPPERLPSPTPAVEPWPSVVVAPSAESEVIQQQERDPADGNAEPEAVEVHVWYADYDAAGQVALETGRPLIVAVTDERPDYSPTTGEVFCWLPLSIYGKRWSKFGPPCVLRCPKVRADAPPRFEPYDLEVNR